MRFAVLTSGGDAPGMNAAIRAVTRAALSGGHTIYGVYDGYKGLVEGKVKQFNRSDVSEILNRGGTILGTARLPEFIDPTVRMLAVRKLEELEIDGLICIGGDGTYRGALDLIDMGIKCIGIPGTIDNDIASTDFTIGFSTALNTAVDAIDKLRDTSSSHQRCSIIEVMGHHCGDLSLYSGLCAGAEYVITNETGLDKEKLLSSLRDDRLNGRKHAVVVVAEGITNVHKLAKEIEDYSGYECRATILGYIQRGGNPTPEDRLLGSRLGAYAIDLFEKGIYNCALGIIDNKLTYNEFKKALSMKKNSKSLFELVEKIN